MSLLEQNLQHLPWRQAEQIRSSAHDARFVEKSSRDGLPIVGIEVDGLKRFFHSQYAPIAEADRIASAVTTPVVVVFGAGLGYHIAPLLERKVRILLVEPSGALLREYLSRCDVTEPLRTEQLALAQRAPQLISTLTQWHIPALHGDLSSVTLPGRIATSEDEFKPLVAALLSARETIAGDLSTQARYGVAWSRHLFCNLSYLHRCSPRQPRLRPLRNRDAVICGAGPSLDTHLSWIRRNRKRIEVVATDTSLPALISHGVVPDLAFTIDANPIGAQHLLISGNREAPLAVELSSPPALVEAAEAIVPFASGNPLHLALIHFGIDASVLSAQSGSVTHAAVRLAIEAGAHSVTLAGTDLSYPQTRTYARHTYVDRVFDVRQHRLNPSGAQHLSFLLDRPGLKRVPDRPGTLTTALLESYREGLRDLSVSSAVPLFSLPSGIDLPPPTEVERGAQRHHTYQDATSSEVRDVLKPLDVRTIPSALAAFRSCLSDLQSAAEIRKEGLSRHGSGKAAALSLLPVSYALRARNKALSDDSALRAAAELVLSHVDHALAS